MIRIILMIQMLILTLLISCSYNSGAGSEVEGIIQGRAIFDKDDPVIAAEVRLRPLGFLALENKPFIIVNTITKENGNFYFDTLPEGTYVIEINYNEQFGALQTFTITSSDTFPISLPTVTVTRTGAIYGSVNLPITDDTSRPWIALYNVDRLIQTPLTQDFSFEGIPAGSYNLRIVPCRENKLVIEVHDIIVMSDSSIDIGTLNFTMQPFFKGCSSYECDSIAVRSILDENSLSDVSVGAVTARDVTSGRITVLDLSGRAVSDLTRNIGSLSELTTLNVRNNSLTFLPQEIGYLHNLQLCYLDNNNVSFLPLELGFCSNLETLTISHNLLRNLATFALNLPVSTLDMSYNRLGYLPKNGSLLPNIQSLFLHNNQLELLPEALLQKELNEFTIANNRLCITSVSLSTWLSTYDEDWADSQECSDEQTPE